MVRAAKSYNVIIEYRCESNGDLDGLIGLS